MPNVGNLSVKLTANASEFSTVLAAAQQRAGVFANAIQNTFARTTQAAIHMTQQLRPNNLLGMAAGAAQNPFGIMERGALRLADVLGHIPKVGVLLGGTAAVAGGLFGLLGSVWEKGSERILATGDAARRLGVSSEFASVALAMAGSHTDEMSSSLLHLKRLLGEAALGSTEAQSKFRMFGIDAEKLTALPMEQQFRMVLDRLRMLPPGIAQSAMAFELFGRASEAILPQLTKSFDEFKQRVADSGTMVSGTTAQQFKLLSQRFGELRERVSGIGVQVATGLIPYVLAGAESLGNFGITGAGVARAVTAGIEFVVTSFGKVLDVLDVLRGSLKIVEYGFVAFTVAAAKGIQYLVDLAAKLPDSLGGAKFQEASRQIGFFLLEQKDLMGDLASEAQKAFDAPSHVQAVHAWFDAVKQRMDALAQPKQPFRPLMPWNNFMGAGGLGGAGGQVQAPQALIEGSQQAIAAIVNAQVSGLDRRDNPIVRQIQETNAILISVRSALQGLANGLDRIPVPQVAFIAP